MRLHRTLSVFAASAAAATIILYIIYIIIEAPPRTHTHDAYAHRGCQRLPRYIYINGVQSILYYLQLQSWNPRDIANRIRNSSRYILSPRRVMRLYYIILYITIQ